MAMLEAAQAAVDRAVGVWPEAQGGGRHLVSAAPKVEITSEVLERSYRSYYTPSDEHNTSTEQPQKQVQKKKMTDLERIYARCVPSYPLFLDVVCLTPQTLVIDLQVC